MIFHSKKIMQDTNTQIPSKYIMYFLLDKVIKMSKMNLNLK